MNKKQILIMAGIGVVCFGLSFVAGLFLNKPKPASGQSENTVEKIDPMGSKRNSGDSVDVGKVPFNSGNRTEQNLERKLSEKQLRTLVFEMRSKLAELDRREKDVTKKEQQINTSMEELQKNAEELKQLRVKLASMTSSIKEERKKLEESLIRIDKIEQKNIQKTAAIYDKMKSDEASLIIMDLFKNKQIDYAVKILYYMNERTSANLIAEIANKSSSTAALISDKLSQVEEQ